MPIAVIVILAILLFLLLLLSLSVYFTVEYRESVILRLRVLFFTLTLYPKGEKHVRARKFTPRAIKRRERKALRKAEKKAHRAKKRAAKRAKKAGPGKPRAAGGLKENVVLVRALVAALLRKTGKHLHLRAARLHIRVATGDAATTAILYGAVSASVAYLFALVDRATRLHAKPHNVSVVADYLSERSSADVRLVFSMRVFGALILLFHAALTFVTKKRASKKARVNKEKEN